MILEGESLVNDASALVLYRTAVAAAVTGAFSWGESVVRFFIDAGVGAAIGLAVGWLVIEAARRTRDSLAEVLLTLAGPYVAWIAAETLHVSAVLACVAGGLYVRQHLSTAVAPLSRIQARAVWDLLVFTLNAVIFLLLGAQSSALSERSARARSLSDAASRSQSSIWRLDPTVAGRAAGSSDDSTNVTRRWRASSA